jgi:hypothetical protein
VKRPFRHGPEELQMIQFFDYARAMSHQHPGWKLAYHIPNERKASIQRRITMARAGVKKGVPDICIPFANDKYSALYIEMKVKPNRPSKEQVELIKELLAIGCYACICWSALEAIEIATKYISNKL